METYAQIHNAQQGKSSDKWESYLPVYERLFRSFRGEPIAVLEVGVQNGGSLEVLAKYFAAATQIIGCDIDPQCGNLKFEDPRISVITGDINSPEVLLRVGSQTKSIDVFIDDGSHFAADIVDTFVKYFPLVTPGGVYLIEDTHCLYWENWGGGILRANSAQQLFKLLTDVLNYEHWQDDLSLQAFLTTFFAKSAIPAFLTEGWMESIEFRNSMIVIHKAHQASHYKLGNRLVVGDTFEVAPGMKQYQVQSR
jgi:hypothetical protein